MNITNVTVLFRSDSAASFTSSNTTLGNATYNAPDLAYENDTKRFKVGVGNGDEAPVILPGALQISL